MFFVDTNVFVYAADKSSPFNEACRSKVEAWRKQPGAWFTSWNVLYEFLRVTTHSRVMREPWKPTAAQGFVDVLLRSPGLQLLGETKQHSSVLAEQVEQDPHITGNRWHDAHIAILMREHGIRRIYTRDTDFHRFDFIEVLDPAS